MSDLELDLPRDRTAPSVARHRLADWLAGRLGPEDIERARLLTSELVANAVLHGEGKVIFKASVGEDQRLLVEVIDQGHGFEHTIRAREFDEIGGNGLRLVEAEASRWGVHEGTTHVWFELEPSGPRLGREENPLS
ncbi:MAG TPA: ATP-binding protein [Solirubrobacteraceae bacterium]|jgi:anti-sigma regulatory factor (Ser/Thr protein kinase)